MRHRRLRATPVSWIFTVAIPPLAAAGAWVWTEISTSARECAIGEGSSGLDIVVLAILAFLAPFAIGWQSRRMTGSATRAMSCAELPRPWA